MAMENRCRCSSLSMPWLLLLLVVLLGDDDTVAAMAMPRPLLGIAEPPTVLQGTAAGPVSGASRPGGRGGRRPDWSMAGAEVILAGFAAAVTVIVFCYIRITRKNNSSTCSDVRVMGVGVEKKQQQQQRL